MVEESETVEVRCDAPDLELLFVSWLNAVIYEMAVRTMLFSTFRVVTSGRSLTGTLVGEKVDPERHRVAVEAKGATVTALRVQREQDGRWFAQCVVDVSSVSGTSMNLLSLTRRSAFEWCIEPTGSMRVPGIIYAGEQLIGDMGEKVHEQLTNVATLPGIQRAAYAMPDAHWGYGFPIGGVAAFDPDEGWRDLRRRRGLRHFLWSSSVAHGDSQETSWNRTRATSRMPCSGEFLRELAARGRSSSTKAKWMRCYAVARNGQLLTATASLKISSALKGGSASDAKPECVSQQAKKRQAHEMGTLGSGNHYLEVQRVAEIVDSWTAPILGLRQDDIVVRVHCGSRFRTANSPVLLSTRN